MSFFSKDSSIAQTRLGRIWEVQLKRYMFARIERFTINENLPHFELGKKNIFTVKECYKQICILNKVNDLWSWKLIGKTKLPTKVICFNWIALNGECLTQDTLTGKAPSSRLPGESQSLYSYIVQWPLTCGICFTVFLVRIGSCHII